MTFLQEKCTLSLAVNNLILLFVSDLRNVSDFLQHQVSSTHKTDCHDITEILLKFRLDTGTTPTIPGTGTGILF
jgi:hypothetical protein